MHNIEEILSKIQNERIYIVGYGRNGKNIAKFLSINHIKFCGFVDKKNNINEKENIINYSNVESNAVYIISSPENEIEMVEELEKNNIDKKKIISFCEPWIIEEILNQVYQYLTKYSKKIKQFKDINNNQTCFIVGNGPSLKIEDLEIIYKHKIKTFAANSIYYLYDKTCWRPTYYVVSDPIMTNNILLEDLDRTLSGVDYMFTSINSKMIDFDFEPKINYIIQVLSKSKYTGLPLFSSECDKRIFLSGTVTYQMLQLAVYMGFKTIYLIGVDCSYALEKQRDGSFKKNNVLDHNNIIQENDNKLVNSGKIPQCWADVNMQIDGYRAAKKYAERNDIQIFNATRGGKLEVFERVNFELLF